LQNVTGFFVIFVLMKTLDDLLRNAKKVQNNLLDQIENIILSNSQQIEALNVDAFQQGEGSDGNNLESKNTKFNGVYSLSTQFLNPEKVAGNLYTFLDSGDFLNNFKLEVSSDLTKVKFFSTGTGSGDKAQFFKDYKNLFGLDQVNADIMRYKIILPKLQEYVNANL
jgi:hypothetical protein